MDAWEKRLEDQRKRLQKLLADPGYKAAIQQSITLNDRIVKEHLDLAKQFNQFDHLIKSPVLEQIEGIN